MAELLVRIKDKDCEVGQEEYVTKRGDVITYHYNDKEEWGREELSNPEWRIVRCELINSEVETLVRPKISPVTESFRRTPVRPREWKIDLDNLPNAKLFEYTGKPGDEVIEIVRVEFLSKVEQKPNGNNN